MMMRTSVAVVLLLFAMSLSAQAPKSFAEGVLAFEKKEWKKAEKLMRETIAVNPKESSGTVSIAGSWFETYVPHYFLARALARQGKCAEALKEFEESERQGVTPTIPDFARHLQTRGGCKPQAKPTKPREIVFETTVPFAEEGTKPATTSTPPAKPRETVTPRETVKPRETAAPPPREIVPTRDLARESAIRSRLAVAITAYLHGRYDETARLLTETKFDDRAAAAEAALFRAAARFALYRIAGEKDAALRAQIDADVRQYRSMAPNARPDPRVFPPSFIALTR
jgi:tetratricopeptide (TPR) repeat protein